MDSDRRSRSAPDSRFTPEAGVVRVRVFDTLEVEVDGHRLDVPGRCRRLIAVLALRGPLARSMACGLLWPEVTEDRARASLRAAVHTAQRVLPGLITGAQEIRLADGVHTDVTEFRHLVRASRRATGTGGPNSSDPAAGQVTSDSALDLLPGGPLGGPVLPEWNDDWVITEREVLGQLRLRALDAWAAACLTQGDLTTALELAAAAVQADPLRESAHRRLMQIHLTEGNIAAALGQFARFRELSQRALGIEPSRLMLELVAGIRRPVALGVGS